MKPITIGIDGNEANVIERVGVSTYTLELLKYFSTEAHASRRFIIYLRKRPIADMPPESEYFSYRIVKGPFFWSQIFLPIHLYLYRDIDVFFATAHYVPRFCPIPQVVTIHDLSFLLYPEEFRKKDLYQLTRWTAYSLQKASHIIAVSKTTKKDLINWYQIPEERISMIYNGFDAEKEQSESDITHLHLKRQQYLLYLGTLQPRKNITTLIQAFTLMKDRLGETRDFKLVIAGKKGWLTGGIELSAKTSKYKNDIIMTGYVSNATQRDLYEGAFAYVLPSRYEGFGIPVLEAMSRGCPVIASGTSSLPEIGGDAALYFPPENPQELYEELEKLIHSSTLRDQLIAKGKKRVQEFSWEQCGKETLEILGHVAHGK
jgi:glycosyltransferase involved in cell wall biosynthesis